MYVSIGVINFTPFRLKHTNPGKSVYLGFDMSGGAKWAPVLKLLGLD